MTEFLSGRKLAHVATLTISGKEREIRRREQRRERESRRRRRRDAQDRPRDASRRRGRRRRRERTVRGERRACTRDRESQPAIASLATLSPRVHIIARGSFWRARSALAARRRPIDADRSRPPRTTLTLTPITRNYVSSLRDQTYMCTGCSQSPGPVE